MKTPITKSKSDAENPSRRHAMRTQSGKRKRYSLQTKRGAVSRVLRGEKKSVVAKEVGISGGMLSTWEATLGKEMRREFGKSKGISRPMVANARSQWVTRRYDPALRIKALKRIAAGDKLTLIAQGLKVPRGVVSYWKASAAKQSAAGSKNGHGNGQGLTGNGGAHRPSADPMRDSVGYLQKAAELLVGRGAADDDPVYHYIKLVQTTLQGVQSH